MKEDALRHRAFCAWQLYWSRVALAQVKIQEVASRTAEVPFVIVLTKPMILQYSKLFMLWGGQQLVRKHE